MARNKQCAAVDVARALVERGYSPQICAPGVDLFAADKWQFTGTWAASKNNATDEAHKIYCYIGPRPTPPTANHSTTDHAPPARPAPRRHTNQYSEAVATAKAGASGLAPDVARWCTIFNPLSMDARRDLYRYASTATRQKMAVALKHLGVEFKPTAGQSND